MWFLTVGSSGSGEVIAFVSQSALRARILEILKLAPRTPTEVANMENKHVSHVSRALAELKRKGIVEPVPGDSRQTFYRLTTQGYIVYTTLYKIR